MADFSFLAVPNIEGMRFLRYLKVVGIVLIFGVCLFFLVYFWVNYRKEKRLIQQLEHHVRETQLLEQQLLIQKIGTSSGKQKLILFIEYLERFATNNTTVDQSEHKYASIPELLLSQGFTVPEIKQCEQTLYTGKELPLVISTKIDAYFIHY